METIYKTWRTPLRPERQEILISNLGTSSDYSQVKPSQANFQEMGTCLELESWE